MPIERTCKKCGKKFVVPPSRIRKGGAIYCSNKCRYDDKAGEKRVDRVTIACPNCGKKTEYIPSYANIIEGYCSRECWYQHQRGKKRKNKSIERDTYKQFWYYCKKSAKKRGIPFQLTVFDIQRLYIKQRGRCAISGFYLQIPYRTSHKPTHEKLDPFNQASLDRINSSGIYEKSNVQLVSYPVNLLKNKLPNSDVISFFQKHFWRVFHDNYDQIQKMVVRETTETPIKRQ